MTIPKGTNGRIYGGDSSRVHIPDGMRTLAGRIVAGHVGDTMRLMSQSPVDDKLLCPGCYMIALYNAAIDLAVDNGQSLEELGATLGHAFQNLAETERRSRMLGVVDIARVESMQIWQDWATPIGNGGGDR